MNEQDVLERQYIVARILKLIEINGDRNLSIGINGTWGYGKSFVLHMIDDELDDKKINNKYVLPFYYDVWKYDYYEEPLISLISFLYKKISSMKSSILNDKEQKLLNGFALALSGITENLTGINPSEILEKVNTKNEEKFDLYTSLNDAIEKVNKSLKDFSETFKIVFIIDELDRCLPEYAVKVLERLHHICEDTNCIQLIAYDKNQLTDSIGHLYGKKFINDDEKNLFADFYLRKFEDIELILDSGSMNENIFALFSDYDDMQFDDIVTKEKFLEIANTLISIWGMRNVKQLIQKSYFIHNLTKNNEHSLIPEKMRLGPFSYILLISELIQCICYFELHTENAYFTNQKNSKGDYFLALITKNDNLNINKFKNKIKNFNITVQQDFRGFITYKIDNFNNLLTYILSREETEIRQNTLLPQKNNDDNKYSSEKFFIQEFCNNIQLIM